VSDPKGRIPLWLRLAARLLPRDARQEVLDDLVEKWRALVRTQSRWASTAWALRQPFAAIRARVGTRGASVGGRRARLSALRRRPPIGFSWLDLKLGVRMLGKQPVVSLVAGLTLMVGIPAALIPTHLMSTFSGSLPVDEGERVVGLRYWNVEQNRPSLPNPDDFAVWRETLTSFEAVGAAWTRPWNVHSPDGRAGEVRGAEVTAAVLDVLRVPPVTGRTLLPADEVEGAPDVVLISEDLWASRFARDPEIVGQVIGIGRRPHTVVGVMPEGFHFPSQEQLWLPLRADPDDYAVRGGPSLMVLGRLAEGVSRDEAAAELRTVGARLAADWPETYAALRAEVVDFGLMVLGEPAAGFSANREVMLIQLFAFALLAVVCGNIGTLVLARTAMRLNEIAVRTALGASRTRILAQLFTESLVLAVAATMLGLVLAQAVVVRVAGRILEGDIPYWTNLDLSLRSVLLALAVGAGCAVVAGVLPAIRATSPRIQENLQRNSRGATLRFGRLTTVLVVAEVALSVGFLCFGTAAARSFLLGGPGQATMDVDRYLVASLRTPQVEPTEGVTEEDFLLRIAATHEELRDRLAADGAVRRVAMGERVAGMSLDDEPVMLEGSGATTAPYVWTGRAWVHVDYFSDLGIEVLQGRAFTAADVEVDPDAFSPVVVNDRFVDLVLGPGDPVGRRLRFGGPEDREPGPWHEIVGVVESFGTNVLNPERSDAVYLPMGPGDSNPMSFIIEVAGSPAAFVPRLRAIAAEVDPDAIVQSPEPLSERLARARLENRFVTLFVFVLSVVGMVLAATGLYALMSVTVSQRTREIGIRTALGARARDVVVAIARRALLQLVLGVALGCLLGWWLLGQISFSNEFAEISAALILPSVAAAVIAFSVLCCLKPTLRGLRIQPTEALKEA
jgi:predicted permease